MKINNATSYLSTEKRRYSNKKNIKTDKKSIETKKDSFELSEKNFSDIKIKAIRNKIKSGFYNDKAVTDDIADKLAGLFDR